MGPVIFTGLFSFWDNNKGQAQLAGTP